MLTEVLLEVTNQEIEAVATEAVEEAKSKCLVWQRETHILGASHTRMHVLVIHVCVSPPYM